MKKESNAVLLRIFIGESDCHGGKPLYKFMVEYLKKNGYAGITVLRGLLGFGHASNLHSSDLLTLSSDLPLVVEIVDTEDKIEAFKEFLDKENVVECGLITQEKVKIVMYGKNDIDVEPAE